MVELWWLIRWVDVVAMRCEWVCGLGWNLSRSKIGAKFQRIDAQIVDRRFCGMHTKPPLLLLLLTNLNDLMVLYFSWFKITFKYES